MLKKILIITPIVFVLLIAILVILHWQTDIVSDLSKDILNANLGEVAQFEYSSLSGDLLKNVIIRDLRVSFTSGVQIISNYLKFRYSLDETISGRYFFDFIQIDSLYVYIPPPVDETEPTDDDSDKSIQETLNRLASSIPLKDFLARLPEFGVDDLEIANGTLIIENIDRSFENIKLNMTALHQGETLELNIERLSGVERSRNFELILLQAQIIGNEKRINLNQLEVQTPYSQIHGYTEITLGDSLWVVLGLEDTHISFEDVQTVSAANFADSGYIDLAVDLVGHPHRFSATVVCAGKLNEYRVDSLVIDGDYQQGEITLRNGLIVRDTTSVHFRGKIAENNNVLDLYFANLNLVDIQPDLINTDLTGSFYLKTESLRDPFLNGIGRAKLFHSIIDTSYLDTVNFAIHAKDRLIKIIEPSYIRIGENSVFYFSGQLDKDQNVDLKLSTEKNSINSLTSALNLPSAKGSFDGNFFLSGKLTDPDLEGYLWIPHLEKESFELDSMIMQINLKRLVTSRQGRGLIMASHWHYDSLEINQTIANVIFDSNRVVIDTLLFANKLNYVSSTGFIEALGDTIDIVFDFFRLNYQNTWLENEENLYFRLAPEEYVIESAIFRESNDGIIEIRGYWDRINDDMQLGLYLENISFSPFRQFMQKDFNFSGTVDADIELVNPISDPELDVDLRGRDLEINLIPLGDVHCTFKYAQQELLIDEFKMSYGTSTLDVDGDIAVSWKSTGETGQLNILQESFADIRIYWKNLRLENYFVPLKLPKPPKGNVSGHLFLEGTIIDPKGQLTLIAENISYNKFKSDSLYLRARFNRDSLIVEQLDFDLNDTDLSGTGWHLLNLDIANMDSIFTGYPFQLNLVSKDDQINFIGNFLDQVERIEGPYEAAFTIGGTLERPALVDGYFRMEDGQMILSRIRNPITELEIDATIDSSILVINSLSAYANKETDFWDDVIGVVNSLFRIFRGETRREGGLYGDGYIILEDLTHPKIDLSLNAYKLYLDYFVENTNFIITTNDLHIFGRDTIAIEGSVTIEEGNYIVDLDKVKKNIYLASTKVEQTRPMTWNLDLSIPGNFNITSSQLDLLNNFKFEIMGDLRTIQEANAPNMDLTGHLEIISGKYGSWGQNFGIKTGTIDFTDPKVINPDIDISAEKRTGDYIVELNLSGNLDKLVQHVQVKDINGNYLTNLTDQEVLSLVSLGTIDFNVANAGGHLIGTSVETAIERGTEALTGLDKVEISSSKGGNLIDIQSMKLNEGIKDASVSLGKYLTSDLYVEYTGMFGSSAVPAPTVTWNPGNQLGIQYRINKNWSIDSYYLRTQRGNNIYNVSLAWKLSF
ncbi:MAG: translocation/assembly module TamB domain-containing protein [Calditrichia bacterium]|nr:translocation/assembly module TamB domain-containing protein [Calditrichia bacterium]